MTFPQRAVVISLPRRPDRLGLFMDDWRQADIGIPLTIQPAIDGRSAYPRLGRREAAEMACVSSHLEVLRDLDAPTLVLEDDARISAFRWRQAMATIPRGWSLYRFGGARPTPARGDGWALGSAHGSHAYLTTRPEKLVHHVAGSHGTFDARLNNLITAWTYWPDAIVQDPTVSSDITGVR